MNKSDYVDNAYNLFPKSPSLIEYQDLRIQAMTVHLWRGPLGNPTLACPGGGFLFIAAPPSYPTPPPYGSPEPYPLEE